MVKRSPVAVEITGIEEVESFLDKKNKGFNEAVTKALSQVGFYIEAEVKASIAGQRAEPTSVDTGHFLQSVSSEVSDGGVVVFSAVEYAPHLEYGTSKMRARPHFRNTASRNEKKVKDFFVSEIKKK